MLVAIAFPGIRLVAAATNHTLLLTCTHFMWAVYLLVGVHCEAVAQLGVLRDWQD